MHHLLVLCGLLGVAAITPGPNNLIVLHAAGRAGVRVLAGCSCEAGCPSCIGPVMQAVPNAPLPSRRGRRSR